MILPLPPAENACCDPLYMDVKSMLEGKEGKTSGS